MAEVNIASQTNLVNVDSRDMCNPCIVGGVKTQAGSYCQVCSEYICDTSEEVHRRFRATWKHDELKPFDVSKKRSIKQNAPISSVMRCTVHESDTLTLFC